MTQIGNHDDAYLSTPLEQKLAWFQNAPGLSAVQPASQFMAGAAALYTDSDTQVRATMRSLGADWTGDAAASAGATLQRAADWSQGAGAGSSAGGETVEGYGKSFESLRGQVHWDDPWAWGWSDTASAAASVATLDPAIFLGNLTTDYFTTAQQNRTNDAAAVAALRAHEQQTRTAVDSFPALAAAGIDPSSADTGIDGGGPHPGTDLQAASIAPAGVATSVAAGGAQVGAPGALGGGVASGLAATAADGAQARGGGVVGDQTGGAVGAAAIPIGGGTNAPGPIGAAGAATGAVGGAGAAIEGTPGVSPGPGAAGPGAGGAGGLGAGGLGAGGLGGGGLATRPTLPGALGGVAGRASGATIPDVGSPQGSTNGLADGKPSDGAGGWRDVVSRGPSEPGAIPRGPTSGTEFAARLPSGSPETPQPIGIRGGAGASTPFIGGMGAGAGARSTEHRRAYWIRSSEPFDVPLPPHGDGLLQGSAE